MKTARKLSWRSAGVLAAATILHTVPAIAQQLPPGQRPQVGKNLVAPPLKGLITGGSDSRVASTDPATGRIRHANDGNICTAWLASNGAFVSAGHCFADAGTAQDVCPINRNVNTIIEFNVPLSSDDGALNPSEPRYTFPIDQSSIQCEFIGGPSQVDTSDWALFAVQTEAGRERAAVSRRAFYRATQLQAILPIADATGLRVTGYGTDGPPPGYGEGGAQGNKYNGTQQTAVGALSRIVNNGGFSTLYYQTDMTQGASGAALVINGTRQAYGINVGAIQSAAMTANRATGFGRLNLATALHGFPGTQVAPPIPANNVFYVDPGAIWSSANPAIQPGSIYNPFLSLTAAFNRTAVIATPTLISAVIGNYPENRDDDLGAAPYADITVNMAANLILDLPLGDVELWRAQHVPR